MQNPCSTCSSCYTSFNHTCLLAAVTHHVMQLSCSDTCNVCNAQAPNTLSLVTFLYDMIYLQRLGPSDGREQRLLAHVKATTQPGDAQAVLSAIDGYA